MTVLVADTVIVTAVSTVARSCAYSFRNSFSNSYGYSVSYNSRQKMVGAAATSPPHGRGGNMLGFVRAEEGDHDDAAVEL